MSRAWRRKSWFGALRRDGRLFLAVAALLLLANMLQPLAEAKAASSDQAWIICTTYGEAKAAPDGSNDLPPVAADDCPMCIAGHPCASFAPAPPILTASVAAWPEIVLAGEPIRPKADLSPVSRPPSPAAGIRAPPPSA